MEETCLRDRPIIEVRDVRKEYPLGGETVVALKRINLRIRRGEICCIFGTSGSGKSTLLNQLAGMEKPTRGEVKIGGACISRMNENELAAFRQRHLGFVFQSYNLLPNLTATENVAMPLMFRGVPAHSGKRRRVSFCAAWGCPTASITFPARCRAVSSSVRESPAPLLPGPTWCLPMSRPGTSIPKPPWRSWT